MKGIILLLVLGIYSLSLSAQSPRQIYQLKALGKTIGTTTISCEMDNENVHYLTTSFLEVNLLIRKIRMEIENKTHYRDGLLYRSSSRVIVNGKLHNSSLTRWLGKQYDILIDQEAREPVENPIRYSGSLLYFREPVGIQQAYSEASGQFMPVRKQQEGYYIITDPESGRDMEYHYENDQLNKVNIRHPLLKLSLTLQESEVSSN